MGKVVAASHPTTTSGTKLAISKVAVAAAAAVTSVKGKGKNGSAAAAGAGDGATGDEQVASLVCPVQAECVQCTSLYLHLLFVDTAVGGLLRPSRAWLLIGNHGYASSRQDFSCRVHTKNHDVYVTSDQHSNVQLAAFIDPP